MTIQVTLNTDKLQELISQSPALVDKAVRQTAFYVQGLAQMSSPVLTGANRNSIMASTSQGTKGAKKGPLDIPSGSALIAYVGPTMEYSARLEFGFNDTDSLGRSYHQAARPYLSPAAAQAPSYFNQAIKDVFK